MILNSSKPLFGNWVKERLFFGSQWSQFNRSTIVLLSSFENTQHVSKSKISIIIYIARIFENFDYLLDYYINSIIPYLLVPIPRRAHALDPASKNITLIRSANSVCLCAACRVWCFVLVVFHIVHSQNDEAVTNHRSTLGCFWCCVGREKNKTERDHLRVSRRRVDSRNFELILGHAHVASECEWQSLPAWQTRRRRDITFILTISKLHDFDNDTCFSWRKRKNLRNSASVFIEQMVKTSTFIKARKY